MATAAARRFGTPGSGCSPAAPAGLALATAYAYDRNGNLVSETVSGGNVAARTATASAFAAWRWPGRTTNALGHAESFVWDARFGLPKRSTDANGRAATHAYDRSAGCRA